MIQNAKADLEAQAVADFVRRVGCPRALSQGAGAHLRRRSLQVSELDALVAYLQMLGTLVDFTKFDAAGPNLR